MSHYLEKQPRRGERDGTWPTGMRRGANRGVSGNFNSGETKNGLVPQDRRRMFIRRGVEAKNLGSVN